MVLWPRNLANATWLEKRPSIRSMVATAKRSSTTKLSFAFKRSSMRSKWGYGSDRRERHKLLSWQKISQHSRSLISTGVLALPLMVAGSYWMLRSLGGSAAQALHWLEQQLDKRGQAICAFQSYHFLFMDHMARRNCSKWLWYKCPLCHSTLMLQLQLPTTSRDWS